MHKVSIAHLYMISAGNGGAQHRVSPPRADMHEKENKSFYNQGP